MGMRYPKKPIITPVAQIINFLIFNTSNPKLFITFSCQLPSNLLFSCGLNVSVRSAETNENPAKHSNTTHGRLAVKNAEQNIVKPFADPSR